MPEFAERQNKNRDFRKQKADNDRHKNIPIPYRNDPEPKAADFFLAKNDLGLSYTRKQALVRYKVLKKSGHHPRIVLDSFPRQTFPNTYQSIVYHLRKHGQGMRPGEYAEAGLAYFIENYYRAHRKEDRTGKMSWNIKGKVGGWWTMAGRIITFWF